MYGFVHSAMKAMGGGGLEVFIYLFEPEGKSYLVDPGIDGRIILRWTFRKWNVYGLDRSGSG